MALAQEDIGFIKAHLGEWLAEQSLGKPLLVEKQPARPGFMHRHQTAGFIKTSLASGFAECLNSDADVQPGTQAKIQRLPRCPN